DRIPPETLPRSGSGEARIRPTERASKRRATDRIPPACAAAQRPGGIRPTERASKRRASDRIRTPAPLPSALAGFDLRSEPRRGERLTESRPKRCREAAAERAGFEPAVPLRVHMISNHAPSTTRSPLHGFTHGGESGIRTHGTLAGTPDFESGTFDHSVISPRRNMAAGQHAVNGSSALAEGCLGAGKRRARVGREWHLHQIPRAAIVPACVRFLSLLGA